jgi:hypothetical protein
MSALEALSAAKAAGVNLILDGEGIIVETKAAKLPEDLVALIVAAKPDLLRILEYRDAARAALKSDPPADCGDRQTVVGVQRWKTYDKEGREMIDARLLYGDPESRWELAMRGLIRFVAKGWADLAALLGWTKDELYRVPALWSRVGLTGAALLIGDKKVAAVTADAIELETERVITTVVIENGVAVRKQETTRSQLKLRRKGREHVA